jgi:alpha-D-xyloside xylohydrolase
VYRGGDGAFTLYEDEGDNYNYEKGARATIPINWNESAGTLELGKRAGSFKGMLKEHTFRVVWVAPDHGIGIATTKDADVIVHYTGKMVKVVRKG